MIKNLFKKLTNKGTVQYAVCWKQEDNPMLITEWAYTAGKVCVGTCKGIYTIDDPSVCCAILYEADKKKFNKWLNKNELRIDHESEEGIKFLVGRISD